MPKPKSCSSQDMSIAEFLKSQEFIDMISTAIKQENGMLRDEMKELKQEIITLRERNIESIRHENKILRDEMKELKQEVIILRESNIELINLLTNTSNFTIPINKRDDNRKRQDDNGIETSKIRKDDRVEGLERSYNKVLVNTTETPKENKNNEASTWNTIKNKERRAKSRLPGIIGTGNNKGQLKAAEKMVTIYVSRLHPDTTVEDVSNFLKNSFPETICEMGHPKYPANYSSFKITVSEKNYNHIMNPEVWPNGAYINKFFRKNQDKPKLTN